MIDKQRTTLEIYLQEYRKLKEEQTARIGFRDNLLYMTMGVFGCILPFAVSSFATFNALLIIR
ncbi:MAG: hypothetical protein QNJ46_35915 [Leptolyngbyaceae cyanobacterium MO_188.B28]|nr:hypothetical protein [Leptolyngbyaceae cyanobacterium MO_188.B28]